MTEIQYRPQRYNLLPEVVKNLLIINVILYIANVIFERQGGDLNDILGLHYYQSDKFRPFQFITYMFMHGSTAHIFFNMFALWMFGSAMENVWGPKRFLTFYILTGLGAAIAQQIVVNLELQPVLASLNDYIAHPDVDKLKALVDSNAFGKYSSPELSEHFKEFITQFNSTVNIDYNKAISLSTDYITNLRGDVLNAPLVVGASGAVFGLLLAYGMTFPDNYIYIYFALPVKAKYFVIIYGLIELFSGIANQAGDNVAHFAHLGGLITGFIIIMIWRRKDKRNNMNFHY